MYSLILQVLRYRKSFAICMHGSSVSFGGNTSSFCIPEKAFVALLLLSLVFFSILLLQILE